MCMFVCVREREIGRERGKEKKQRIFVWEVAIWLYLFIHMSIMCEHELVNV